MFHPPSHCPNKACAASTALRPDWFAKDGYYRTKLARNRVPRFRCRECGKRFGANTHAPTYRQRKPMLNAQLAKLLCSGVTMRRASRLLGVSRRTVARKLEWLGKRAAVLHAQQLKHPDMATAYVQFDEMETYESSKLLPLSIALAVRPKTGTIISIKVAEMNCHGKTSQVSVLKYGKRKDERMEAARYVLRRVALVAKPSLTIVTDQKPAYRGVIKQRFPKAAHAVHKSRKAQTMPTLNSKGLPRDPMFALNHICARLRADLTRLHRRTWSASKRARYLQYALDLWVAYHNGYPL